MKRWLQGNKWLLKGQGELGCGTVCFVMSGSFNEWKENKITMRRVTRLKVMVLYGITD